MRMDVGSAWKLGASNRALWLVIPLCAVLLASATWNVRQYRTLQERRLQTEAADRAARAAAEQAEAEAKRAQTEKKAERAAADARVQQLYEEINNLTRMSEQVMLRNPSPGRTQVTKDSKVEFPGAP
jgi:hypothetical protein